LGDPDAHWNTGALAFRLNGWLTNRFGAFPLAYELNDRYPAQPLSLAQLQGLGAHLAAELAVWTASPAGQQHHQRLQARLAGHRAARAHYFASPTPDGDLPYVLLTLGFSVGEDEE